MDTEVSLSQLELAVDSMANGVIKTPNFVQLQFYHLQH